MRGDLVSIDELDFHLQRAVCKTATSHESSHTPSPQTECTAVPLILTCSRGTLGTGQRGGPPVQG